MAKKVGAGPGLPWRFTDKRYTAWGGLRVLEELLRQLKWTEALRAVPLPQPGSNRGHNPVVLVQAFLLTVWTGGGRFAHTALVRFDEALCAIFGLAGVPSVSTFTRFFRRFDRRQSDEVFGRLSRWFRAQVAPQTWTVDVDSSVLTRYGHQEGGARGYNPTRRGKRSHHPLLAFAAECRMVVTAWLRPGNTTDGANAENFLREVRATLEPRHRIGLLRGDSGFCVGTLFQLLESWGTDYIVVARLLGPLKRQLAGLRHWVEMEPGVAVAECEYEAIGWNRARRVVAVRFRVAERSRGQCLLEVPGYTYAVYVTSLRLPPAEIRRLYLGRADSENRIKELRQDFAVTGFASQKFWATEAAFRLALFAYNLMSLFRQALLGTASHQTLATWRTQCFAIGASLGRTGSKQVLRLGLSPPRRAWFEGLFASAQQITTPCLASLAGC